VLLDHKVFRVLLLQWVQLAQRVQLVPQADLVPLVQLAYKDLKVFQAQLDQRDHKVLQV
jgi:hypothetical protein